MVMSDTVIQVENLSKRYRLGVVGTGTLRHDFERWWARVRGKPDPTSEVGQEQIAREKRKAESETGGNGSSPPATHSQPTAQPSSLNTQNSALSTQHSALPDDPDYIWALRDVSFEVKRGEVLGIIGRNGAGKSTLLKILSRVTAPTAGEVRVNGRIASLLEVGTGFHQELTGRENIFLNGAILGMTKAEIRRKFDEIVAFSEVEKFIDTPVKRYSSGMYVRLAFAVAAHLEPEILIVDEVLSVGDAQFQKKCLGKMGDVAKAGRTVLFVSHNMAAVEGLCSRAIVLSSGGVVCDDISTAAIESYLRSTCTPNSSLLKDRMDRQGNGAVTSIGIRILNQRGEETNQISMGDSFTVELHTLGVLKGAIIGISFGNMFQSQLVRGYSWEQVPQAIDLTGDDVIRCHFKDFPLMHGTYDVHVWIGRLHEVADYVERATTLTVQAGDVFGTGRQPDALGGVVFCRADWEINGVGYA